MSECFGQPAAQHRDRAFQLERKPDDIQIITALGGPNNP